MKFGTNKIDMLSSHSSTFSGMTTIPIEQALYGSQGGGGYRFLGRSAGFLDAWLPAAEELCAGFGERPAGVRCPECVFARPLGRSSVAIVQAADQGSDDAGRPGALGFRLLVLPRAAYVHRLGDPFVVAASFPPDWQARGELPTLSWPDAALPDRTVAQVQKVLQRADGPTLLGSVQALVDGGRLAFQRPEPDTGLLQSLWTLLPSSTRAELWPASFAFGNDLGFDAVIVPRASGAAFDHYVTEEQAEYYPEGRYELGLQTAAEAGDQGELDALFARRSRAQTWRLGLFLLVVIVMMVLFSRLLTPPPRPAPKAPEPAFPKLELRPTDHFPDLNAHERGLLTRALLELAQELMAFPVDDVRMRTADHCGRLAPRVGRNSRSELPTTAEALLVALDRRLGTPATGRDPGAALDQGPLLRRLRALLWKHAVLDYQDPGLGPAELVDRLRQQLLRRQPLHDHDG